MKIFLIFFSLSVYSIEFKVGDLILQSLDCYLCRAIESETNSNFSHIGMVINDNPVEVIEAYQSVRIVPLSEYLTKTKKNSEILILRSKEITNYDRLNIISHSKSLLGLKYDSKFLWNDEDIYCSELIYLLFDHILLPQPKLKYLDYSKNYKFWKKYFKGEVPEFELGISPEAYVDMNYFEAISSY